MTRYALLLLPAANRVYAESAAALMRAELELFNLCVLEGRIESIEAARLGGVRYITFQADRLTDRDLGFLANLSSIYALFALEGDLLRPVDLAPLAKFDDDLVTIQKYPGKTNEQFTKLLMNATLLSCAFAGEMLQRRFQVLDPLCGRGTTLNQALMYGFDAAGVDRDQQDFDAYSTFFSTWLKRKRIKHHLEVGPVRRNRQVVGRRLVVTLAPTKQAHRDGDTQRLDMVNADTTRAGEFFRPESFDLLVADAPYGVQHGSRTAAQGLVRGPLELLAAALPVWVRLMRPGGAIGLAWNTHVADREELGALLAESGLEPLRTQPYLAFRHRVDQSIRRDVIIARKESTCR
jgi:SAM-dependent methyltransferase